MKVGKIALMLEKWAPESNAESFDNVGLLVGNVDEELTGILVTLDCLEEVIEEAIHKKCNMIITFHPIIFSGLKSITGNNYVEKAVAKAIKHDIAIYAIHTNLDIAKEGVNFEIGNRLHLKNLRPLISKKQCIKKLHTYVPFVHFSSVQQALFNAGAGEIGNYKNCSFRMDGRGTFIPTQNANPYLGKINNLEEVEEALLSVIFEDYKLPDVLQALKKFHPYEEVAYEVYTLDNENQDLGMGRIGELEQEISEEEFLLKLKKNFLTPCIRHTVLRNKPIKKVAVLGGSGSFAIKNAISQGADTFVTADITYHKFFQAEGKILLIDIGHYESEQYTKNLIYNYLTGNIGSIPIYISEYNTNPVNYFI